MDKVIRILTWTVFGVGFVLVVLVSLLASLTGRAAFAQQPPAGTTKSKVKVNVPQENATLVIEGKATSTVGMTREFDTPDLEPGKKYLYEFKVSWKPNKFTTLTRTRTVQFVAGYEGGERPLWLWEEAILQGYEAFRFLCKHRRGRLIIDMENHSLRIEALPQ